MRGIGSSLLDVYLAIFYIICFAEYYYYVIVLALRNIHEREKLFGLVYFTQICQYFGSTTFIWTWEKTLMGG